MTAWAILAAVLMVAATIFSFLPVIPGPAAVWAIGLIYAVATNFADVGVWAVVLMTVFMIVGSTADFWTPYFGLQAEQSLSCGTFVVSTIGAIIGTFAIPVPIAGTFIGAAVAVMALVWYQKRDWDSAQRAGRGILKALIASFLIEFAVSVGIVMVFVYSIDWRALGV